MLRKNRQHVGPNLVRCIAVRCNSVGTGNDEINLPGSHERRCHAIANAVERDLVVNKLKSGQS